LRHTASLLLRQTNAAQIISLRRYRSEIHFRFESCELRRSFEGQSSFQAAGSRGEIENSDQLRVTLYGGTDEKIGHRASAAVQREMQRRFHLIE